MKTRDRIAASLTAAVMLAVLCIARAAPRDSASGGTCAVSLRLVDAVTGRALPGLVRIVDAQGRAVRPAELLPRDLGLDANTGTPAISGWFTIDRGATIHLAPGKYQVEGFAGLETESTRQPLDLTDCRRANVELRLVRFSDLRSGGWRSGNTHLHLQRISRTEADRYLRETPRADGLDVLFVSYLERAGSDQAYVSNRYRLRDLEAIGRQSGVIFGNGEEHRHNFGTGGEGYGHVMFLNLKDLVQPVSLGPGITKERTDGIPLRRGIDAARRQPACVVWCHNDWGRERVASLVSGRLDALNIFDGSLRSGYEDSFYQDLNAGFRIPFSTGTDWFLYDFSRVYVRVEGEFTVRNWLKSLSAGRTFITNGPLLDFSVAGRAPGEVVSLSKPGRVRVVARCKGRADFRRMEIVRNGQVIATARSRPVGGHFEADWAHELPADAPCWLALRTPGPRSASAADGPEPIGENELGRKLFAHTSALHVEMAGRRYFERAAAERLLGQMRTSRDMVASTGRFADEQERARVLDVYADGIAALQRRLAQRSR